MTTFKKTNMNNMYQISVKGRREGREAVITKFSECKSWSVAYWLDTDRNAGKADEVAEFKTLSDAKFSAECHVDV